MMRCPPPHPTPAARSWGEAAPNCSTARVLRSHAEARQSQPSCQILRVPRLCVCPNETASSKSCLRDKPCPCVQAKEEVFDGNCLESLLGCDSRTFPKRERGPCRLVVRNARRAPWRRGPPRPCRHSGTRG